MVKLDDGGLVSVLHSRVGGRTGLAERLGVVIASLFAPGRTISTPPNDGYRYRPTELEDYQNIVPQQHIQARTQVRSSLFVR